MANRLHECDDCQNKSHLDSYMFFGNLQAIRRSIDMLLSLDPEQVDRILADGHDWAKDHIASSNDDIQEVTQFLVNQFETMDTHQAAVKTYESFIRSKKH